MPGEKIRIKNAAEYSGGPSNFSYYNGTSWVNNGSSAPIVSYTVPAGKSFTGQIYIKPVYVGGYPSDLPLGYSYVSASSADTTLGGGYNNSVIIYLAPASYWALDCLRNIPVVMNAGETIWIKGASRYDIALIGIES